MIYKFNPEMHHAERVFSFNNRNVTCFLTDKTMTEYKILLQVEKESGNQIIYFADFDLKVLSLEIANKSGGVIRSEKFNDGKPNMPVYIEAQKQFSKYYGRYVTLQLKAVAKDLGNLDGKLKLETKKTLDLLLEADK